MDVQERVIEFCPDVKGPCIGEGCAAFHDGMMVTVTDAGEFVKKVCGEGISIPIAFSLEVRICSKYESFIDAGSLKLYRDFARHFNMS